MTTPETYAEYCRQAAARGAKPIAREEWKRREAGRRVMERRKARMETDTTVKRVIVTRRHLGRHGDSTPIDVAPVIRETKTLVIAGHDGKEQYELKKPSRFEVVSGRRIRVYGDYIYPSDQSIQNAEFALKRKKARDTRERKKREREDAAERADPRYELLQRFVHAEWEPWDKLSLEQLKQIAAILDSVKTT